MFKNYSLNKFGKTNLKYVLNKSISEIIPQAKILATNTLRQESVHVQVLTLAFTN